MPSFILEDIRTELGKEESLFHCSQCAEGWQNKGQSTALSGKECAAGTELDMQQEISLYFPCPEPW